VNHLSCLVQKQLKGCKVLHFCLHVHSVINEVFNVVDIQLYQLYIFPISTEAEAKEARMFINGKHLHANLMLKIKAKANLSGSTLGQATDLATNIRPPWILLQADFTFKC